MKIGCVPYRHAQPFAAAWAGQEPVWAHPKELAKKLWAGEVDLALVPVWEVLNRSGTRVLDGVAIGSRGEVRSVGVFHDQPLADCRSIQLTPHSATSVQLWKLLAQHLGISWVEKTPADARLLIGDVALEEWSRRNGQGVLDLGRVWTKWTGKPLPSSAAETGASRIWCKNFSKKPPSATPRAPLPFFRCRRSELTTVW